MELYVWGDTDRGLKRENNQDSFLIDETLGLFIVADGMGGHLGGEVASKVAVETVREIMALSDPEEHPRDLLKKAYREASHRIYDQAANDPDLQGMGTTMVLACLKGMTLYIANVGDSRCYYFYQSRLWQLTEDHSLLNEQIRAGLITPEQARLYASRNVITRSVGYEREVDCDVLETEVKAGEVYLLCSDGLSGLVDDSSICDILCNVEDNQWVPTLIDQAKTNGGDDNITVLAINFKE